MTPPVLALVLAVVGPDPCAPPPPGIPDARAAEAYAEVAREDALAGRREQAAAAFREALRRAPGNVRARAGFAAACRSPASIAAVQRGVALLEAGSLHDAVGAFEEARGEGAYPIAALAQAVCHLRLADDERARAPLEEALADAATEGAARLLVAVLERRASHHAEARDALEAAARSRDPRVSGAAARLLEESGTGAPVALALYAGSTWDSNERLAPEGAEIPGGPGDAAGVLHVIGQVAPFGANGPFARGAADYRRQARFGAHDGAGWSAAAGWRYRDPRTALSGEYRRHSRWMGEAPYLASDALLVRADVALHRAVALSGGAAWESTRYAPDYSSSFSGNRYAGEVGATLAGRAGWLSLKYVGTILRADDLALSYVEHAPRIEAGLLPMRGLRVWTECVLAARRYADVDDALGVRRDQLALGGSIGAAVALPGGLSVNVRAGWRSVSANVVGLSYEKWVTSGGVAWERSWP